MANAVSSTRLKPSASVRLSVRPSACTSQRPTAWHRAARNRSECSSARSRGGPGGFPSACSGAAISPGCGEQAEVHPRQQSHSEPSSGDSLLPVSVPGEHRNERRNQGNRGEKSRRARDCWKRNPPLSGEERKEKEGGLRGHPTQARSPHPGEVTPPRRGLKNCARPPRGASAHRGFGLCLRGCWPGAGDQIPLLDPFMVLEVTRPRDQSCSVGAQPGSSPTSMMASAGVSRQAMSPPGHAPETKRPGKSVCHCHTGI